MLARCRLVLGLGAALTAGCGRLGFDDEDGTIVEPRTCRDLALLRSPTGLHSLAGRDVWCEQERRGGGWTLALKIDGSGQTFLGNNPVWESMNLLNDASLDPSVPDEAKLAPFVDHRVAEILLVVDGGKDVVLRMRGSSLRDLFASGLTFPSETLETEWRAAFLPGALQTGCRRQGLGLTTEPDNQRSLRLGVAANNELEECVTSDSFVGIGAEYTCAGGEQLSAGNVAYAASAPDACQPHRVHVYVRDDDQTRFASQPTCEAHLRRGRRDDGVYLVGGVPRRCDMTIDGGGWTSALDFDGVRDPCPPPWVADPSDLQICIVPAGHMMSSLFVPSPIGAYTEVMSSVLAYQRSNTDAFHSSAAIDETYVDGLSITTGSPREHIATFASGFSDANGCGGPIDLCNCPCLGGELPPSFVGAAYRCEAGALGSVGSDTLVRPDPLFDGSETALACAAEASTAPIRTTLAAPVTTDIEARLMRDEPEQGEGLAIYRFAIWVR